MYIVIFTVQHVLIIINVVLTYKWIDESFQLYSVCCAMEFFT